MCHRMICRCITWYAYASQGMQLHSMFPMLCGYIWVGQMVGSAALIMHEDLNIFAS